MESISKTEQSVRRSIVNRALDHALLRGMDVRATAEEMVGLVRNGSATRHLLNWRQVLRLVELLEGGEACSR